MRVIGWLAVGLVTLGVVVYGGWQANWWFKEHNVERQAHVFRKSYANQERLREDAAEKIAEVRSIEVQVGEVGRGEPQQAELLEAQESAIGQIACHDISQITEEPGPELEAFAASYCVAP